MQDNIIYAAGASNLFVFTGDFAPLAALVPLLGNLAFHLPTFCAVDPPPMPAPFTVQELLDLGTSTYSTDYASGLLKLTAVAENVGWFALCQCNTGTQPTPAPAPTPPAGAPISIGPGYGTNTTPCATAHGIFTATPVTGGFATQDLIGTSSGGAQPFTEHTMPGGASEIQFTFTNNISGGVPDSFDFLGAFQVNSRIINGFFPGSSGVYGFVNVPSGGSKNLTVPVPAGATGFTTSVTFHGTPAVTNHPEVTANVFCGSGPGQTINPCCPPDASMLQLLNQINQTVTLVQRQIAPFSYVAGTVHAGLSGNGQFSVTGILGLAVHVTTLPSRVGADSGDPNTIFEVGWINTGTSDGWGPRQFISSNPFILRPISGDTTLVGYSIPADVVVSITELIRSP